MMKDNRCTFAVILSGIAIFFSIVAIYTSRPYNWELDFVGVAISVLSVLVTLLVGWNIYSTIEVKSKVDSIDDKLKANREDYDHEISGALYHIYAVNYILQKKYDNALTCLLNGIREQNKSSNPVYLKNIIRLINENYDNFVFSSNQLKTDLQTLLEQIECRDSETSKCRIEILDKLKK